MIGDKFIRAGADYGPWRYGCIGALVHSLEAPAKPGMAEGLVQWLRSEGLSPHTMSDTTPITIQVLEETHSGAHAGSVANQVLVGFEQVGYAAWSRDQWLTALESIKAVARSIARLWKVMGWNPNDVEWGSVGQLQQAVANARAGRAYRPMLWTHFDVTQAFPGTTSHTDPGQNYPFALLRQLVKQYLGTWTGDGGQPPEKPPTGGTGGAEAEDDVAYDVVRKDGVDYVFSLPQGVFFAVRDPDHYFFLEASGAVKIAHGAARPADGNLLEFIRSECARAAGLNESLSRVEGYERPGVLNGQTPVQALAQTRNDVADIKVKLGK